MARGSTKRILRRGALVLAVAALAACGSSGDGNTDTATDTGGTTPPPTTSVTISGTAATGAPVVAGTVSVVCASGAPVTTSTSTTGDYTVVLPNAVAPCAFQVSGGSLPAGTSYHSLLEAFSATNVANITPLTDLVVATLTGATPATWFASIGSGGLSGVTATDVEAALTRLRTALNLQTVNAAFAGLDPIRTQFTAQQGNALDDLLEALQQALVNSQLSYGTLLSQAASGFTLQVNFQQALAAAYALATGGGSGGGTDTGGGTGGGTDTGGGTGGGTDTGGGTGGGTTGNYTLVLNVTASGMALAPITITDVPKPANESEFCSELTDQTSTIALNQFTQQGATGSLTINSCAFNGTVGNVSATLTITSPIQMSVPYSVVYTYQ